MKAKFSIIGLLIMTSFAGGCYYDKEELLYPESIVSCSSVNASFANVNPIVASKCALAGCHNASAAAGGTILETYSQIKSKVDRIRQRAIIEKTMPVGSPLSQNELAILKCWIDSGAPQ